MSAPMSSDTIPARPKSPRSRRLLLVVVAAIVMAGLVGGGYGLWYVLVGPSSPAAVSSAPPALPSGAGTVPAAPDSLDGTWTVNTSLGSITDATASFAGYRVQEQLVGVGGTTAVGRTTKVSGSMTLTGAVVSNVQVTADLTALVSDNPDRDGSLRREALETNRFPTATFKLTGSIDLGALPAEGSAADANATGDFTLHGVTKSITIALQATRQGGIIAVTGSLPIVFADYSIQKPTSFSVLSVDDHGIMELHLLFTQA
jgi:polyisoprenoid-binding protein YceI